MSVYVNSIEAVGVVGHVRTTNFIRCETNTNFPLLVVFVFVCIWINNISVSQQSNISISHGKRKTGSVVCKSSVDSIDIIVSFQTNIYYVAILSTIFSFKFFPKCYCIYLHLLLHFRRDIQSSWFDDTGSRNILKKNTKEKKMFSFHFSFGH